VSTTKTGKETVDGAGPIRSEQQTKQGGRSRMTLVVLAVSLILAAIVGFALFGGADHVAPNRPAAVEGQTTPR
jgi:hypothetical protein